MVNGVRDRHPVDYYIYVDGKNVKEARFGETYDLVDFSVVSIPVPTEPITMELYVDGSSLKDENFWYDLNGKHLFSVLKISEIAKDKDGMYKIVMKHRPVEPDEGAYARSTSIESVKKYIRGKVPAEFADFAIRGFERRYSEKKSVEDIVDVVMDYVGSHVLVKEKRNAWRSDRTGEREKYREFFGELVKEIRSMYDRESEKIDLSKVYKAVRGELSQNGFENFCDLSSAIVDLTLGSMGFITSYQATRAAEKGDVYELAQKAAYESDNNHAFIEVLSFDGESARSLYIDPAMGWYSPKKPDFPVVSRTVTKGIKKIKIYR